MKRWPRPRIGPRARVWLIALLVGAFFGVSSAGSPVEDTMRIARNKLRGHPASGEIALVAIDDRSMAEFGRASWRIERMAELVRRVRAAGAARIFLDIDLANNDSARDAALLARANAGAGGRLLVPARFSIDPVFRRRTDYTPGRAFAGFTRAVNTNLLVNWDNRIWHHPYAVPGRNGQTASLASVLGRMDAVSTDLFPIDYALDMRSIPTVSAGDMLRDRWAAAQMAGKDVVIGRTDLDAEHFQAPGVAPVPALLFHIIAAETLRQGAPVNVGWAGAIILAAMMTGLSLRLRRMPACVLLGATAFILVLGPLVLERAHVFADVVPALALLVAAGVLRTIVGLRRSFQRRGTTNMVSGMPNLQALRGVPAAAGVVVAARIQNYPAITAALPEMHERELVEQIVARLRFGSGPATIHQADEGTFAWIDEDDEESLLQQLEGLHALFRSPLIVASRPIDVQITFGLDHDRSRVPVQRVSSALVAAEEASREGKRCVSFNHASLEDAEWTMSLLGRLDKAIEDRELWVAFQPKREAESNRIVGAEALVRWTHPTRGLIYPDQFIGPAEKGGRIEALTYYVLDIALAAVSGLTRDGCQFTVAVNLSASLLDQPDLVAGVAALLDRHEVDPRLLTLEVTETSALGGEACVLDNLHALRAIGINLSIDDYGTGFSTLEYLKKVPASEIKIDRSFVGILHRSQSDRLMVNSTIQLAHSLGRVVVAEGVENEAILEELRRMQCDYIQGYHTGRPMPLKDLVNLIKMEQIPSAAYG